MGEGIGARSQGRVAQIVFLKIASAYACGDLLRECSHDVIMMGTQKREAQLFSYAVNLVKRVASQSSSAPGETVTIAYDLVTL